MCSMYAQCFYVSALLQFSQTQGCHELHVYWEKWYKEIQVLGTWWASKNRSSLQVFLNNFFQKKFCSRASPDFPTCVVILDLSIELVCFTAEFLDFHSFIFCEIFCHSVWGRWTFTRGDCCKYFVLVFFVLETYFDRPVPSLVCSLFPDYPNSLHVDGL